jgi:hypothetical protein
LDTLSTSSDASLSFVDAVDPEKDSPHTTAILDTPSFSSGTPLPLVDAIDSEEDFYGFERLARRSNRLRTPKTFVSLLAIPLISHENVVSDCP